MQKQEQKRSELDEQLKEYIAEWRKQRAKEEEELKRLKVRFYSIRILLFHLVFPLGILYQEYMLFFFLGETSQAQGHPRRGGEEIGSKEEGRRGTSST